jgi:hypothetical protein
MTAPITSARVRELSAAATPGLAQMVIRTDEDMAHIAKALSLLERVEAGDAGLVEAMISTFFRTTALGAKHTGNVDQLVAQAMADETMRTYFVAALAALVGEVK